MNIAKGLKMPCELEKIVLNSIDTIIKNTASNKKLEKIRKTHQIKLHFIPIPHFINAYKLFTLLHIKISPAVVIAFI